MEKLNRGEFFNGPAPIGEAFSIGLCALSATNLSNYETTLYDMANLRFKGETFAQAVSALAFDKFYSEVLRGTILSLVTPDVSKRISCGDIRVMLEKHSNRVVLKENFVVDNAPPRLH